MTDATNSLPAEALSPQLITDQGYQRVRLPLRTETGTIVYADLLPAEADVLAQQIGRAAHQARQHNERVRQTPSQAWPGDDMKAANLIGLVHPRTGTWTPGRLVREARSIGIHITPEEAGAVLRKMVDHRLAHRTADGYRAG